MDRWREYLGHTVNFKTRKKSYKSKKVINNPEREWVIFENTHEAIWTEAIADAVKLARQTRCRPTKMGEMGMFSGMMFCADCGSVMYQCRTTGFRKDQEYYLCSGYRKSKDYCGTTHSIRTVILEELLLQNLRLIVSFAKDHKNEFVQMAMDMDLKERNRGLAKKKKLLTESEKRIAELDNIFMRLYEDNISGKLTDERFRKLSQNYENEQSSLKDQVAQLREEIEKVESQSANVDRFLSAVEQYTEIPELTPHILHEFVDKIVVHSASDPHSRTKRRQEVDIYYKGIGILEMSKVFATREKKRHSLGYTVSLTPVNVFLIGTHIWVSAFLLPGKGLEDLNAGVRWTPARRRARRRRHHNVTSPFRCTHPKKNRANNVDKNQKVRYHPIVGWAALSPPLIGKSRFCGGLWVVLRPANQNPMIASGNHSETYQAALPLDFLTE